MDTLAWIKEDNEKKKEKQEEYREEKDDVDVKMVVNNCGRRNEGNTNTKEFTVDVKKMRVKNEDMEENEADKGKGYERDKLKGGNEEISHVPFAFI